MFCNTSFGIQPLDITAWHRGTLVLVINDEHKVNTYLLFSLLGVTNLGANRVVLRVCFLPHSTTMKLFL